MSCGVYANLGFSQTKAEKCGIALSHYDIDGHLIFADEKTVLTFVELLQPPPKAKGQFDDVLAAFENEPIDYRLNRLDLPPSAEYRYQLIDESNAILLEKILSNLSALSLPPLPFGYYQLSIFLTLNSIAFVYLFLLKQLSTIRIKK